MAEKSTIAIVKQEEGGGKTHKNKTETEKGSIQNNQVKYKNVKR